jgi:hypothetical protein
MDLMPRSEYVAWAKARALTLVDDGDLVGALASMVSDLQKRPDTDGPHLPFLSLAGGHHAHDPAGMRQFIEGFA